MKPMHIRRPRALFGLFALAVSPAVSSAGLPLGTVSDELVDPALDPSVPAARVAPSAALASASKPVQDAKVDVSLTRGLAKLGEPVHIRITVTRAGQRGVPGGGVKIGILPEVEGIEFGRARGAGTSTFVERDRRGRTVTSAKASYLIEVKPAGPGEYLIPPISLSVDGNVVVRPIEPMSLRIVEDLAASDFLFMERAPVPKQVFEGEPYMIEMDWGWDADLEYDGLNLRLPWYGRQDGVIELELPASGNIQGFPTGGNQRIPVVMLPEIDRDGRKFRAFRLRRRFVATRPGTVEFGRSIFEFAPLPERGLRVIRGRTRSFYRPLDPFSIEVVPVPDKGRPLSWTGAVGTFGVSRQALHRDVDAGEPVDFEVTYSGEGNLEFFEAPDLSRIPAFDEFRVLGVEDDKSAYERVIKYALAPLNAAITEIPPVPLSLFHTESKSYVELVTEPLPIRVRAVEGTEGADPFGAKEEAELPPAIVLRDIEARPAGKGDAALAGRLFRRGPGAGAAFLALLLGLVSWRALRRIARVNGDPASVVARRRRGALRSLERGLSSTDPKDLSLSFEAFLAARTNTAPGEWIGQATLPNAHGEASESLKESYAQLRRDLDAAVFGGDAAQAPSADRVRSFARTAVKEGL